MKALLLLSCSALLCYGTPESDDPAPAPPIGITDGNSSGTPARSVPEPATMLLAGLGGIAMLLFAIRRK